MSSLQGCLDASLRGNRLAVFALDLIRLTYLSIECQLGIMREMLGFRPFWVSVLLITPLTTFQHNVRYC